jgi:hypothetical protein
MNTNSNPAGITQTSAANQIDPNVQTALTAADASSADRVQNLSLIYKARVSRLARTAASVTAQYGATSTQAVAAQNDATAAQTAAARTQILHRQIATVVPTVAATGWALSGRVYDAQLQPVSGYTVFLVDSQKTYQEAYGFAYTDSTGYFLINFSGSTATSSQNTSVDATDLLFVEVANASSKPVYLSASAFQPNLGSAVYQNITLPMGEPALGDPPEAIRKLALPPQK